MGSELTDLDTTANHACDAIRVAPRQSRRRLVALVGPPASGKSTLADRIAEELTASGCETHIVPMDGFHLDNRILDQRGLRARKGAPETFDSNGFLALVRRLADTPELYYPLFDRSRDISIAGAGYIPSSCDTVLVEGNYLLLDQPVWRELNEIWDFSLMLSPDPDTLRTRLIQRWIDHGLSREDAVARAETNDLPNAELVLEQSLPASLQL